MREAYILIVSWLVFGRVLGRGFPTGTLSIAFHGAHAGMIKSTVV